MWGGFPLWSMASMAAKGQEPLLVWIYLSVLFCFVFIFSGQKSFLIFPEIRNSDWAEVLTRFYPVISFLLAKEGHQPPYGVSTRVRGAPPYLVGPSSIVSRGFFFPKIIYIPKKISVSFYSVWTLFDMDILRNKKHATNRNWHWALDQYVSPKNSIKSCQKYMKVE